MKKIIIASILLISALLQGFSTKEVTILLSRDDVQKQIDILKPLINEAVDKALKTILAEEAKFVKDSEATLDELNKELDEQLKQYEDAIESAQKAAKAAGLDTTKCDHFIQDIEDAKKVANKEAKDCVQKVIDRELHLAEIDSAKQLNDIKKQLSTFQDRLEKCKDVLCLTKLSADITAYSISAPAKIAKITADFITLSQKLNPKPKACKNDAKKYADGLSSDLQKQAEDCYSSLKP